MDSALGFPGAHPRARGCKEKLGRSSAQGGLCARGRHAPCKAGGVVEEGALSLVKVLVLPLHSVSRASSWKQAGRKHALGISLNTSRSGLCFLALLSGQRSSPIPKRCISVLGPRFGKIINSKVPANMALSGHEL